LQTVCCDVTIVAVERSRTMDVRQIYRDAQEDLRRHEAELAVLQRKVLGLKQIVEGVRILDPGLIEDEGSAVETTTDAAPTSSTSPDLSGGLRTAIYDAVKESGRFLATPEIIDVMVSAGTLAEGREGADAVRKVVSRMYASDQLVRLPRDGRSFMYGVPGTPAPQNAESAADTALSVVPAPTSDEGRTADVAEAGDRSDHLSRWNDSDGRGAPSVVEG
jgi:hypothetical protein